jgi:hypothetical protein
MASQRRRVSLGFASAVCEEGTHIAVLYGNAAAKRRTMASFLQQGLDDGEKVFCLAHDISPDETRQELCSLGVSAYESEPAFEMMEAHYRHCPDEVFAPHVMLGLVGSFYDGALLDGNAGARSVGEMSWAADAERADFDDVLEYETKLNDVLLLHPVTTLCLYDVRVFSDELITQLLARHPAALIDGELIWNPSRIPMDEFLCVRPDIAGKLRSYCATFGQVSQVTSGRT